MSNVYKFFLEKATVEDIQKFCEVTNYRLVIFDHEHMTLKKEVEEKGK